MSLITPLSAGPNVPNDCHAVIEIPAWSTQVKYEVDKETGRIFVDRFLEVAMQYPCNYGFIPQTLAGDGDPVDVLVVTPFPLVVGSVIRCRPVGMLQMTDEKRKDNKILAVPIDKLSRQYRHVQQFEALPKVFLDSIRHFFKYYKDLDEGKEVQVEDWDDAESARQEILESIKRYQEDDK
jgi:inorganic pyrophosphatase